MWVNMDRNKPADMVACLTTEEVLAYLNVTPRTNYRLIRTGELPAIRIGRQWRFRRSDLDAFLDRQQAVSISAAS
jgi:excisionase family DNA binding protein